MTNNLSVGRAYMLDGIRVILCELNELGMSRVIDMEGNVHSVANPFTQLYDLNHPEESRTMTTLQKLSQFAKKHLDKDVQAFVRLGLMNDSLQVTEKGSRFLDEILFNQFKKELGEAARLQISEMEEEQA